MRTDDLTDHRSRNEHELVAALRNREPLALAECFHRSAAAAHAVARRILGSDRDRASELESVLAAVYTELWQRPPAAADLPLERWVRARASAIALSAARRDGRAIASASLAAVDGLPAGDGVADPVERIIAALDPAARHALVHAHDHGLPTTEQDDAHAGAALERALLALAAPPADETADETADEAADDGTAAPQAADVATAPTSLPLGDLVLGLLPEETADAVRRAVVVPADVTRLRLLRQGRRRLDGLTPAPDAGNRILLRAVTARPPVPATADSPPQPGPVALDDSDIVVTVGRATLESATAAVAWASPPAASVTAPTVEPASVERQPERPSAFEDTGELAVPVSPQRRSEPASDVETPATEPIARVSRGVGLLMVGTAVGLLVGAVVMTVS